VSLSWSCTCVYRSHKVYNFGCAEILNFMAPIHTTSRRPSIYYAVLMFCWSYAQCAIVYTVLPVNACAFCATVHTVVLNRSLVFKCVGLRRMWRVVDTKYSWKYNNFASQSESSYLQTTEELQQIVRYVGSFAVCRIRRFCGVHCSSGRPWFQYVVMTRFYRSL